MQYMTGDERERKRYERWWMWSINAMEFKKVLENRYLKLNVTGI